MTSYGVNPRLEHLESGTIVGKSVFASGNRFFEAQLSEF